MSKKVLLAVLSLSGGGAERVVSVWANELHARGHQVSVMVFKRCANEYYTADGVHPNDNGHKFIAEKICEYIKRR